MTAFAVSFRAEMAARRLLGAVTAVLRVWLAVDDWRRLHDQVIAWVTFRRPARPAPAPVPASAPAPKLPRPDLHATAAQLLEEVADWAEMELAGGEPPKWVAQNAAKAARFVAAWLKTEGAVR